MDAREGDIRDLGVLGIDEDVERAKGEGFGVLGDRNAGEGRGRCAEGAEGGDVGGLFGVAEDGEEELGEGMVANVFIGLW